MTRHLMPIDPSIGERIKIRRQLRRWSIRYAASRAGIAHTTWSRIEKGELRTDRYMIADLAAALECSVSDLTGRPHVPGDRQLELAHARVAHVRNCWHGCQQQPHPTRLWADRSVLCGQAWQWQSNHPRDAVETLGTGARREAVAAGAAVRAAG